MSFYSISDHIYSFITKEFTSNRYGIYFGEKNILYDFILTNPIK